LEHLDTINGSPSHIYHSALSSSSHSNWLQEHYGSELLQEVKVVKGLSAGWGTCSRTVSFGTNVFGVSCWNNIVAVASCHRDVIILDAVTGSQTATLSGHTDEVNSVAFSSDGRSLVSGSDDKTVKLWDVQTGGTIQTFSGHTNLVYCVSISVDSATIASGSFDGTIRVWNVQTGECCCLIGYQGQTHIIKFSPTNSQHFLSLGDEWGFTVEHQWSTSRS
jgi:WD40 repeat protein